MLGRAAVRHGSCCGAPPGLDCTDYAKSKHAQRQVEKRQWRREASEVDVGETGAELNGDDQWPRISYT
jgi:hypothetical protein